MDAIARLDLGYAWTAARIAAVPADGLDNPTPCGLWNLRELLDHTIGALTMVTDVVAGDAEAGPQAGDTPALGTTAWDLAIAGLSVRSRRAWDAPGVMDRMFVLPFGTLSAADMVAGTLSEVVTHGWDIGQASGEAVRIPDELARAALEFARQSPTIAANRGDAFAAELDFGGTPGDQLVAFLGRKPL